MNLMEKFKVDFVLSKFTQNYHLSLLKKLKKKNKSRGNGYTNNNKIIIIHFHYENVGVSAELCD